MRTDETDVKSEGFFASLLRIVGNERGNVLLEGDAPAGAAPAEESDPAVGEKIEPEVVDPNDPDAIPGDIKPAEEAAPEVDPRDEKIASMEAAIQEMREKLNPKGEEQPKETQPAPVVKLKDMNPEQRDATYRSWGLHLRKFNGEDGKEQTEVNINPEQLVEGIVSRFNMVLQMAQEYTDKMVHGNVSDIRLDSVLSEMEKKPGFTDIRQHSDAIKQFLKENYHPKDHSNPKMIDIAFNYAKGKGLKNAVKKAVQSTDRNKVIVKPAGNGAAPAKETGKLSPATMTNEQRRLAESTFRNMPKEKAWAKYCELY